MNKLKVGLLILFFITTLSLLVLTVSTGGFTQILGKAWNGVTYNTDRLQELFNQTPAGKKLDPNPLTVSTNVDDPNSSKSLFHSLSRTYFDAEVQNITDTATGVEGVAFMKYDKELGKTFVFSRMSNLPIISNTVVQLWINRNISEYINVGLFEFYKENDKWVGYSVFSYPEDLSTWENLLISYDSSTKVEKPESVVITLKF